MPILKEIEVFFIVFDSALQKFLITNATLFHINIWALWFQTKGEQIVQCTNLCLEEDKSQM